MPRQRHVKPDANQPADVKKLRELGFIVLIVHTLGDRALDFFTLGLHHGYDAYAWCQWEWKTETGTLTLDEELYLDEVERLFGDGVPVCVGRCVDDVLAWYGWM